MRCLIQRVSNARVEVDEQTIGEIGSGLVIFVCAMTTDNAETTSALAKKCANLRIFADQAGKMNKSLLDIGGQALIVSQFTLAADTSRGNRPSFTAAAPAEMAKALYEHFCHSVSNLGVTIATGRFAADMKVHLVNDGPVTIWLDN